MANLPIRTTTVSALYSCDSFKEPKAAMTEWKDTSGRERHIAGTVVGTIPVQAYTHNGRKVLAPYFDGASCIDSVFALSTLFSAKAGHVFVACAPQWDASTRWVWSGRTPAAAGTVVQLTNSGQTFRVGGMAANAFAYCDQTPTVAPVTGAPTGEVCVFSWSHNSIVRSAISSFGNEVAKAAGSVNVSGKFRLGANGAASPSSFFKGYILEVLVLNTVLLGGGVQGTSATLGKQVMSYFDEKWGGWYNPNVDSDLLGWRSDALAQQREKMSRKLFYFRKPIPLYTVDGTLELLAPDFGGDFYVSHADQPQADAAGWGDGPAWTRRKLRALGYSLDMDRFKVTLTAEDKRLTDCTLWESWPGVNYTDGNLNGVARAAAGDGIEVNARTTNAYTEDAGGEKYQLVWADRPKVDAIGLLMEPAETNVLLRSAFVNGVTGITRTGSASGGRLITTVTTLPLLFETAPIGVTTSQVLAFTYTPGTAADLYANFPTTGSIAANTKVCVQLIHQAPVTGGAYLKWQLKRSFDAWYWNEALRAWQSGAVFNETTAGSVTSPEWNAYAARTIDVGTSATSLTLYVGWQSADLVAARQARLAFAQVQTVNGYPISPIVTTTATVSTQDDWVGRVSPIDNLVMGATKGTLGLIVRPKWDTAEVSGEKVIARHTTEAASNAGFVVLYDATNSRWTFRYHDGAGGTTEAQFSGAVVADTDYKVMVRWTSSAAELGLTARTMSIFVDGVKGGVEAARSNDFTAADVAFLYGPFGGYIIGAQAWREPLTDSEIAGWEL